MEILEGLDELGQISSLTSRYDDGTLISRFISFNLDGGFDDPYGQYEIREGIVIFDDVEKIVIGGRSYRFEKLFSKYE